MTEQTSEAFPCGQRVYVRQAQIGWATGTVVEAKEKQKIQSKTAKPVIAHVVLDTDLNSSDPPSLSVFSSNDIHPIRPGAFNAGEPDLFRIGDLHVAPLLHCLTERYRNSSLRLQYHKMGDMILSVNPFAPMTYNLLEARNLCLEALTNESLGRIAAHVPCGIDKLSREIATSGPHVWHVADRAYRQVIQRGVKKPQAILISGESGSGKTENTKALITYLGELSSNVVHEHREREKKAMTGNFERNFAELVNRRIQSSNPILEAFGNAKTVRNDNSSRFGKYIKLHFASGHTKYPQGSMLSGEIVTYLLERSRVCGCAPGERVYHVFYMMIAGLPSDYRESVLGLKSGNPEDYSVLLGQQASPATLVRLSASGDGDVNEAEEFSVLINALKESDVDSKTQDQIWRILAFILRLLCNVKFEENTSTGKAFLAPESVLEIKDVAGLVGLDPSEVSNAILVKTVDKFIGKREATVTEAYGLRDALCKVMYCGVFDYLVACINKAIAPAEPIHGDQATIGILDIFGFEDFKVNSFEQLCINYANESLANHYNRFVFKADKEECWAEGVPVPEDIVEPDNSQCLSLFSHPKTGIFAKLTDRLSGIGGDDEFVGDLEKDHYQKHPYFHMDMKKQQKGQRTFVVKHYAREVTYTTTGWCQRNADLVTDIIKQCLSSSTFPLVKALVKEDETALASTSQRKMAKTVAGTFHQQLERLRQEISPQIADSHFVRCIKPFEQATSENIKKAALCGEYVAGQLESAAVLQTIELKRQGYPMRRSHEAFADYFHGLAPLREVRPLRQQQRLVQEREEDYSKSTALDGFTAATQLCELLLRKYSLVYGWKEQRKDAEASPGAVFAIGKTLVFVKSTVWSTLEKRLLKLTAWRRATAAKHIVNFVKGMRATKHYRQRMCRKSMWRMKLAVMVSKAVKSLVADEARARSVISSFALKGGMVDLERRHMQLLCLGAAKATVQQCLRQALLLRWVRRTRIALEEAKSKAEEERRQQVEYRIQEAVTQCNQEWAKQMNHLLATQLYQQAKLHSTFCKSLESEAQRAFELTYTAAATVHHQLMRHNAERLEIEAELQRQFEVEKEELQQAHAAECQHIQQVALVELERIRSVVTSQDTERQVALHSQQIVHLQEQLDRARVEAIQVTEALRESHLEISRRLQNEAKQDHLLQMYQTELGTVKGLFAEANYELECLRLQYAPTSTTIDYVESYRSPAELSTRVSISPPMTIAQPKETDTSPYRAVSVDMTSPDPLLKGRNHKVHHEEDPGESKIAKYFDAAARTISNLFRFAAPSPKRSEPSPAAASAPDLLL